MLNNSRLCALTALLVLSATYATASVCNFHETRRSYSERMHLSATPQPESAIQGRAWLQKLSGYMHSLGCYTIRFSVETGGQHTSGSYTVNGNDYYLSLGDAEVYGAGDIRYEVDNRRHEVLIDRTNPSSHNILDNPTRAFDFAESEFEVQLRQSDNAQVTLSLRPRTTQGLSTINLTLDARNGAPKSIEYDFDGERIRIAIVQLVASASAPKSFAASAYSDYEIIDFR